MPELPRQQLLLGAVALVVIGLLGMRYLGRADVPLPAADATAPAIRVQADTAGGAVVVHVAGAVRRPGVYRLRAGTRVHDAVRRAGGATGRADLGAVNLAAKVEDARQVLVPAKAARGAAVPGAVAAAAAPAPGQPLNLNSATLEQLDTLDGVGPATAQKILDHREEHDGFGSVEELGEIPGIGEKRLASLREQVSV